MDTVEIAVKPVLLGGGTPLLPPPAGLTHLRLTRHRVYAKTGTLSLEYEVVNSLARKSAHPGGCSAMPAGR